MKLKYDFMVQEVADGFVAVAVGSDAMKFSGLMRMNGTGAFILEQLKEDISLEELVGKMAEKYDADEETLRSAAENFLAKLKAEGILLD